MPELTKALASDEAEIRSAAVSSLGRIVSEPKEIVPTLIEVLGDDDWLVRKSASAAIARVGPPARDAVPPLMKLLGSDQDRRSAVLALRSIDRADLAIKPMLIEALREGKNGHVLYFASWFLGKMGAEAEEALPGLREVAEAGDDRVRTSAREAIALIEKALEEKTPGE